MKAHFMPGPLWLLGLVFSGVSALGETPPSPPTPVFNQPVVVNSFESVEMEKLRLSSEAQRAVQDQQLFRERVAALKKKLAGASVQGVGIEAIPTDLRSFLSASQEDVKNSTKYYSLMKDVLSKLSPTNPYLSRTVDDSTDPRTAEKILSRLSDFQADDGVSLTIRNHIGSLSGGRVDTNRRRLQIDRLLRDLDEERKRLEWNFKMTFNVNTLTGRPSGTEADRVFIGQQIQENRDRADELRSEKDSLGHKVLAATRKLQFQQLIVELAMQQRYIHALIACGFYRHSFKQGNMALSEDAYPSPGGPAHAGQEPSPESEIGNQPTPSQPATGIPVVSTITAMEVLLTNRIRDAMRDRESIDNMIDEDQTSAAESLLRKMVTNARYQPELHTISYENRQKIQKFTMIVRQLDEALNSLDYDQIEILAGELSKISSDTGSADLLSFAREQPSKALFWIDQAEVAIKLRDIGSANTLLSAAKDRCPLDGVVEERIKKLQDEIVTNSAALEDLRRVVKKGDYQEAYSRMDEFAPLVASGDDSELRGEFEQLIEQEKSLRTSIERSESLQRFGSTADAWLAVQEVPSGIANDPRVMERKNQLAGSCPAFIGNYTKARLHEEQGRKAVALAFYLSALSDAPGNETITSRIQSLGDQILNN